MAAVLPAESGLSYTFRLTVTDPKKPSGQTGGSAFAALTVLVNAPPAGGLLRAVPLFGTALQTVFALSCEGWADPEGFEPLTYAFSYRTAPGQPGQTSCCSIS